MRISDWSSDVCSSDLAPLLADLLPRCRDRGCTAALRSFLNHLDPRRLPGPVEDRLLAPIGANVEREGPIRGGQPVGLLVPAGRGGACIEGQRAVFVELQVLVLGPERVAIEVGGMKEMTIVVERSSPEAVDRRITA